MGFDDRVDNIMYQDPSFPEVTEHLEFHEGLKPLWLESLARPEAELQRMAADTIALAHRAGMKNLEDTAAPLIAILRKEQLEPSVRRAAAHTLVVLDARQAAEHFAEIAMTGSQELAMIVEPALASWNYEPMLEMWRQRLTDSDCERVKLQLAMRCLGEVKDSAAVPLLLDIVTDSNAEGPVRHSAARVAAIVGGPGVVVTAGELSAEPVGQPTASLLAVTLLEEQSSPEAIDALKRISGGGTGVASGLALRELYEIDPKLIYDDAAAAIRSTDVNVRRVGCETLAHRADVDSIALLAPLLSDSNPSLRRDVSNLLLRLAEQISLRDVVIQHTVEVASRDDWRGLEQSLIVLAMLDHEAVADRLLELLTHRRPEVRVTAAWGLRKLAVAETLPAMLLHANQETDKVAAGTHELRYAITIDMQLSQLFQAFGQLEYKPADPLMRKFIPKTLFYGGSSRPAAVWALGKVNAGGVNEELSALFAQRLKDGLSPMPEFEDVRRMSAVGLGRMEAKPQLKSLRTFVTEVPSSVGQACAWSIEHLTGETTEFSLEYAVSTMDWFLIPKDPAKPTETD
ncbi:MAG: hypothetical protein H6822_13205 [Planctomycetaceae bacterium]|nr:hypothetical protein [Planctomycetales bacterium]MCB9923136.1 hypothetical protein [Planctomycetaceae bacterium]